MSLPTELLLDTGTNLTNLSWGTWQQLSQRWTPASIIDGVVRAGVPSPPAFLVCLPNVSIGSVAIADQAVRIQRPVESGAFSTEQFAGILGSEILREFKITFDLKHDRIFLERDSHFKPDPYRYTTIGIQFARNSRGEYSVMSVWKKLARRRSWNHDRRPNQNDQRRGRSAHEYRTSIRQTARSGGNSRKPDRRTRREGLCPDIANTPTALRAHRRASCGN